MFSEDLTNKIREKFHHVDHCPYQGKRIFFENAGGSLTLKQVVDVNTYLSAIPDNHGRDNVASVELVKIIEQGRQDMMLFFGVSSGQVFLGETGTELLYRLIRTAAFGAEDGGNIVGSTLEHPATVSAGKRWAKLSGREYIEIPHDTESTAITADDYLQYVTAETRVATIIHNSPVSGKAVDLKSVANAIRSVSPACFIIVDGIQHAAHGGIDVDSYNIDAYTVSAYKVFSKHNYGVAWISSRMTALAHDRLDGSIETGWELGTRDTAAYATFSEVVKYLDWLGSNFIESDDRRERLVAAGKAMQNHESALVEVVLKGAGDSKGLSDLPGLTLIGGDTIYRAGVVSFVVEDVESTSVVSALSTAGIRTHVRKNDYFSGNILNPLGWDSCIRASVCHYNTIVEVKVFLNALRGIIDDRPRLLEN